MTINSLIQTIRNRRHFRLLLAVIIFLGLTLTATASALSTITQSYVANERLSLGSIVSMKDDTSDQVVVAMSSNVDSILGVVVPEDNSLLSLSSDRDSQVQVATNGTVQVLVSDINGVIEKGDYITASPIGGVGMKATDNVRILGIAQGDLNNSKKQIYKNNGGEEQSANIGDVPVLVNVSSYFKEPEKTLIPVALQNIANSFAGKKVDTLPVLLASAIFVITLGVVVIIIYSMIRSSIISVGRNPMSQSAIYRDLIQLSALVMAILTVGFVAIYLILTRM